jgi:hypothetical protein
MGASAKGQPRNRNLLESHSVLFVRSSTANGNTFMSLPIPFLRKIQNITESIFILNTNIGLETKKRKTTALK